MLQIYCVTLAALWAVCAAMPMNVAPEWVDCGRSENRSLFLTHFDVQPHPVQLPGKVNVSMLAENRHEIENMALKLTIKRHIWSNYFLELPCSKNYGSCEYKDLCGYLNMTGEDGEKLPVEAEEPMMRVKQLFNNSGHPLKCPLAPAVFEIDHVEHELPELPPLVAMVAAGKYKIRAEFYDPVDYREIGCFELTVTAQEKKEPEPEDDYYDDYEEDDDCFFFC